MNLLYVWFSLFSNYSVLGPGGDEIVHEPLKSRILISQSPMVIQNSSPIDFQRQVFWRLTSLMQAPRAGVPQTSSFLGRSYLLLFVCLFVCSSSFPVVGCHVRGKHFGKCMSLILLPISIWPFYTLMWNSCSDRSQILFRGNCSTISRCLWEEVSSVSSYIAILNYSLQKVFILGS